MCVSQSGQSKGCAVGVHLKGLRCLIGKITVNFRVSDLFEDQSAELIQ